MDYDNLVTIPGAQRVVTEERILAIKEEAQKMVEHYIAYPDLLLDTLTPPYSNFRLFPYQRIFLRTAFRYRYVYATFTRAFSKSFLSIIALYLRCMLLPGSKVFICADVKEQAAKIATEKIKEIWDLFPLLKSEMSDKVGEKPQFEKDSVRLIFKNGSLLDVVGVANSARGGRRHGGLIEEAALIDGDSLNEVVLPLMNINRRTKAGLVNQEENHQMQLYVTTAGYTDSFAYDKMTALMAKSIVDPSSAFVWGGDYRIPVHHGLLNKTYIEEIRTDPTFKETSFAREYMSIWSGTKEEAFFAMDKLNRHRTIVFPEYKATTKGNDTFYVIAVDVGRLVAQTVAIVFRVNQRENYYQKNVVNIYTFQDMHFQQQACKIKELQNLYNARQIVIDGNGIGVGLLDYMIQFNSDAQTGRTWAPIGTSNDDDYKKKQPVDAPQLIYVVKANMTMLNDVHANALNQINSGKVRFLVDEKNAKAKLMTFKKSEKMSIQQKMLYLMPYQLTSILIEEMLNLRLKNQDGRGIQLERITRRLGQDKFSAFEYGLWYIKEVEEAYYKRLRSKRDLTKFIMIG